MRVEIRSSGKPAFIQDERFEPFLEAAAHPDIVWGFHMLHSPQYHALEDSSGARQAGETPSHWVLKEIREGALTRIDLDRNRLWQFFDSAGAGRLARHGLGPAMLALFLPRFNALMLHASAIVRNGRAAVFLAPDEGGKTTAVRLAPSGAILGDDQVIVRRRRGTFHAWGTPWGLYVNAREHAPLAGLFLLKKAKRFSLTPLPARSIVPFIWEEIKGPLAILPKPSKKRAFNTLCDIAEETPAWTLAFPKHHIDWQEVDEALRGE